MFRRKVASITLGLVALACFIIYHFCTVKQLRETISTANSEVNTLQAKLDRSMSDMKEMRDERDRLLVEIDEIRDERDRLLMKVDEIRDSVTDIMEVNLSEAEGWAVRRFRLTGYAPFDNKSGMCHDGDPTTTASGSYPKAGRTIAVDPKVIPLGTQVWVEGHGWRVAEDTGGLIKGDRIDIMVDTYEEALEVTGEALVIYPTKMGME